MNDHVRIFFHACYVAFAFSCLLFGALAYRQTLENLSVRRLRAGEDRRAFLSAPAVLSTLGLLVINIVVGLFCYQVEEPTVYAYALPLVIFVQNLQLMLRTYFQRTVAKTKALVVRSTLLERVRVANYGEIIGITFTYDMLWVTVTIDVLPDERISFRIFRGSAPALARILLTSCVCPIRTEGRGVDTHTFQT